MTTETPELTPKDFARPIPARLRERLMEGRFDPSAACWIDSDPFCAGNRHQYAHASKFGAGSSIAGCPGRRRCQADGSAPPRCKGLLAHRRLPPAFGDVRHAVFFVLRERDEL